MTEGVLADEITCASGYASSSAGYDAESILGKKGTVGGGLEREWMGGHYAVRCGDLALLKP